MNAQEKIDTLKVLKQSIEPNMKKMSGFCGLTWRLYGEKKLTKTQLHFLYKLINKQLNNTS
jgi:hypothetical protein